MRVRVPPSVRITGCLTHPLAAIAQLVEVSRSEREGQGSNPCGGTHGVHDEEGWQSRYCARPENGGQGHTCGGSNPTFRQNGVQPSTNSAPSTMG